MKLIMEVGARDKMKIHLIKNGGAHGAVGGRLLRACCFPPWSWSYQVCLAFFFFTLTKYFLHYTGCPKKASLLNLPIVLGEYPFFNRSPARNPLYLTNKIYFCHPSAHSSKCLPDESKFYRLKIKDFLQGTG